MHTLIREVFYIMRDYSAEASYHDVHKMVIATAMKLSEWRISQIYIFWEIYVIMNAKWSCLLPSSYIYSFMSPACQYLS